jgi:exosortase
MYYMTDTRSIKAIILAGSCDFGRCPVASRLPTALWPVVGKPVLEHLLVHLAKQGISQVVICSNGDGSLLRQSIRADNRLDLDFLDEQLPVGTAGSIRDAACGGMDAMLLVFPSSVVSPPRIDMLIQTHRNAKSDLTVLFNPVYENHEEPGETAGIYVCNPALLKYIPRRGYYDIKESLIPELLRAGKTVHSAILRNDIGNFHDRQGYLCAVADYLENTRRIDGNLKLWKHNDSHIIWKGSNVIIEPGVRLYGRVVILNNTQIAPGAVVFGPTILGRNVSIGRDSIVVNSVLWDGAKVGPNCEIQQCVFDYGAVVRNNTVVQEKSIPFKPGGILENSISRALKVAKNNASELQSALQSQLYKINEKLPNWIQSHKRNILPWFAATLVLIAFLWSYWPGFVDIWNIWQRSDEYSSGLLVPFLAVYILWSRRKSIVQCHVKPSVWGVFVFLIAQGVRFFGLFFMYNSAERLSIVLSIAALVLLLFGWQFFRKVATVLLFLSLMLPWPNRFQAAVALPLQNWATSSAVFCLEMMGYEAVQEGNIIHIGPATVAIAEACNGLRMVMAFFVVSGLVVLLIKRAWWEKLIILASSLPIALLCNTVRLAITAFAFTVLSGEQWEKVFHDFGGYAMMPLALAAVVMELWLLAKLTKVETKEKAIIIIPQKR